MDLLVDNYESRTCFQEKFPYGDNKVLCVVSYHIELHHIVSCHIIPYCIILYCIVLYHTIYRIVYRMVSYHIIHHGRQQQKKNLKIISM